MYPLCSLVDIDTLKPQTFLYMIDLPELWPRESMDRFWEYVAKAAVITLDPEFVEECSVFIRRESSSVRLRLKF